MTRSAVTLRNHEARRKVAHWAEIAPPGTRVEFRGPRRTNDQNALMWALLADVAEQREHCGRRYDAETWKAIFMSALGREMRFVPSLDGQEIIPLGHRSSELSKAEMSDLVEFVIAWGAQHGVTFSDQRRGRMRVLVCGGRNDKIHAERGPITLVIHGCATGADSTAAAWAIARSIDQAPFQARWKQHGKAAGPLRNQAMIDTGRPDLVVAFPGGRGTADMTRRARVADLEVVRA